MKPSKNRIYCKECGRTKMLFETQKQADTFIKFNSEEIKKENGYCPTRSYFCIACNGWHVTSHREKANSTSKSEIAINKYRIFLEAKEKRKILDKIKREQAAINRKTKHQTE